MSTRGEIERDVALLLGEDSTSPGGGESLWLRQAVVNATDHVARLADAYQTYYDADLAGTSESPVTRICVPGEIYRVKAVRVTPESGDPILLREYREIVSSGWMDRRDPYWRTDPKAGTPTVAVLVRPDLILYPLPDWTATDAVRVYGFATPGEDWAGTGAVAHTDSFPLPEFCRAAVVYQAAWLRCVQFPSKENQARAQMLAGEKDAQVGLACRDAQREYSGMGA